MTERIARLEVPGRYEVVVGNGVLDEVLRMFGQAPTRAAVCAPVALPDLATPIIAALESAGSQVLRLDLPDGEAAKTAAVAVEAWEALGAAGFTRSDVVVTVGGGATTDMGGFIAATWLRGVRVVHVPTTLLAMVDAAVGGKTGMNTSAGKNLVGSFHEPAGVVCDLDCLRTLPATELVAGLAEVLKCGFIADPEILAVADRSPEALLDPDSSELREVVERAIRVKVDIVADDLRETGGRDGHPGREALNYGHTFAHALEKATDYRMRHGDAVALGMVFVAELSRQSGHIDETLAARHAQVLESVGLPTSFDHPRVRSLDLAGHPFDEFLAAMRVDKKARGAQLRFVVLDGLARPVTVADPALEDLRAAHAKVAHP
ncbi:MAG: 3-dehydroquinate synthase [Marmoricola sp.]